MANVKKLRDTLQLQYNEALTSPFDADLFLALDLALAMIGELQERVTKLDYETKRDMGTITDAHNSLARQWDATQALAAPDADPSPTTVTIDRKEYDQALRLLVQAAGDSDPAMRRLIVDAIDHLKGQN